MGVSSDKVTLLSGLLVFMLCVAPSLCQDEYSGSHSGEEHTYEGSMVDRYDSLASPQPEYPPEPTHSYDQEQRPEDMDYDPFSPEPTQVTMIIEDAFPYATTAESHYAKEDTETIQVPYEYARPDTDSSEESGGDAAFGEEGPTECDCEPGQPGFAGFAGPKVQTHH